MGIDRRIYIMNGWTVTGREQVRKMEEELEKIDEYYMDEIQNHFVDDSMCGEYAYFGAKLISFDPDYDSFTHAAINEKLLYDGDVKYKKFLEEHPKYAEIFQKYTNNEPPQVMVVLRVW